MKRELSKKKILKIERNISFIQKDLYETELDYSYLSTPNNLSKKIQTIATINYEPMHFSRIYLNYSDFINSSKKITKIKSLNEKEKEKNKNENINQKVSISRII